MLLLSVHGVLVSCVTVDCEAACIPNWSPYYHKEKNSEHPELVPFLTTAYRLDTLKCAEEMIVVKEYQPVNEIAGHIEYQHHSLHSELQDYCVGLFLLCKEGVNVKSNDGDTR